MMEVAARGRGNMYLSHVTLCIITQPSVMIYARAEVCKVCVRSHYLLQYARE